MRLLRGLVGSVHSLTDEPEKILLFLKVRLRETESGGIESSFGVGLVSTEDGEVSSEPPDSLERVFDVDAGRVEVEDANRLAEFLLLGKLELIQGILWG